MGHQEIFGTDTSNIATFNTVYVSSVSAFDPFRIGDVATIDRNMTFIWSNEVNTGPLQIVIDNINVTFSSLNPEANTWITEIGPGETLLSGSDIKGLTINRLDITSINGGTYFNLNGSTQVISFATLVSHRVIGFDSLGSVDSLGISSEGVVHISNGEGMTINNASTIQISEGGFVQQTGDHYIFTGTSDQVTINQIVGDPSTGDRIFNIDALTVTGHVSIDRIFFDDTNGGTTGLVKIHTSDAMLDNIFTDIRGDTTSAPIEFELPESASANLPTGFKIYITDLGNAGTNNITVVQNTVSMEPIDGLSSFVLDKDDQIIIIERANGQWIIIGNSITSRWIGEIGFEDNSTDTSLSKDTPADISGTFTSGILERHTRSGGEVTYTGLEDITENITVSASIKNGTGGGKRNIQVHLLLDTGAGFSIVATHNASMSAEAISLSFTKAINLSTGDKYKAQVENIENNDDMLVTDVTIVGVRV